MNNTIGLIVDYRSDTCPVNVVKCDVTDTLLPHGNFFETASAQISLVDQKQSELPKIWGCGWGLQPLALYANVNLP